MSAIGQLRGGCDRVVGWLVGAFVEEDGRDTENKPGEAHDRRKRSREAPEGDYQREEAEHLRRPVEQEVRPGVSVTSVPPGIGTGSLVGVIGQPAHPTLEHHVDDSAP